MPQSRQLAAIMFTDIVGYTSLMEEDEEQAFSLLEKNRQIQRPIIEKYRGQWLKEIGDGVLASFSTASEAVLCAKEIQEICVYETDLKLRIGIHLGEVVFEGEDVFGSGVNIASRLQPLASIGGILVSESIYKNVRNKKNVALYYKGEEQLRGVKEPVKVYQVEVQRLKSPAVDLKDQSRAYSRKNITNKAVWLVVCILLLGVLGYFMFRGSSEPINIRKSEVTDEKWIAVLPFVDMSAEQNQEYMGDGIAEELINTFAKAGDLKVIARTSSFQFKGESIDVRDVGSKLNANYVVEGSVRKDENQLRITVQLIDAEDGSHIWSEDYDRPFSEILAIQSEISQTVYNQLSATLGLSNSKLETNVEAYELFLKAKHLFYKFSRDQSTFDEFKTTEQLFQQVIQLDSNFVDAYAGLSDLYDSGIRKYPDDSTYKSKAKKYAELAFQKDPNSSYANMVKGLSLSHMDEPEEAFGYFLNAITINPTDPDGYYSLSHILHFFGLHKESLSVAERMLEIDPLDYGHWNYYGWLSSHVGRLEEAKQAIEEHILLSGQGPTSLFILTCLMRNLDQAKTYLADSSNMSISPQHAESLWLAANRDTNAIDGFEDNLSVRVLLNRTNEDWTNYFENFALVQNTPSRCCGISTKGSQIGFIVDPEISVDEAFLDLMQPIINDAQFESTMRSFRECQERNRKRLKEKLEEVRTLVGIRLIE